MSVFKEYARYYDLLYRDKDYQGEAGYVHRLIRTVAPDTRCLLNLGCGSGRHDCCLAELGYDVCGVDLSEGMLQSARDAAIGNGRLTYVAGDVRTVRLGRRFDAVISLFHVMSYQTGDDDLQAAFATAREHLIPGGLFLFDCWYGQGVLSDPPAVRVKELEDEFLHISRTAHPTLHLDQNIVDVNYEITVYDKATGESSQIREIHRMRYLFLQEITSLLQRCGFQLRFSFRWLTTEPPDDATWYLICGATRCPEESR